MPQVGQSQFFGTDLDVYHFVRKLVRAQPSQSDRLDFFSVYSQLQRTNLPLKRKSKPILERSIDRVLAVVQQDRDEAGDEATFEFKTLSAAEAAAENADPNIMNRIITSTSLARISRDKPDGADETTVNQKRNRGVRTPVGGTRKRQRSGEDPDSPTATGDRTRPAVKASRCESTVAIADLANMGSVVKQLARAVGLTLWKSADMVRWGFVPQRGVILSGPSGCGKTAVTRAISSRFDVPFFEILGPSMVSGVSGESEKAIREVFEAAREAAPAIIFIDEIDSIGGARDGAASAMEKRILTQLLVSIDSLDPAANDGKAVIVIAATNHVSTLDPALRRGQRFGTEITVPAPDQAGRTAILRALTRNKHLDPDVDFVELGRITSGFVGADLKELVGRTLDSSLDEFVNSLFAREDTDVPMEGANGDADLVDGNRLIEIAAREMQRPPEEETIKMDLPALTMEMFMNTLPSVEPSLRRLGFVKVNPLGWDDVAFPTELRTVMEQSIIRKIREPEFFRHHNLPLSSGVLLWGPPGCGKTLLANVVAHEAGASIIVANGSELLNKYVGESEKAIMTVFARARAATPSIIFFDEFDALASARTDTSDSTARVVNMLLTQLDGLMRRDGVHVIASTNRPDTLDPALTRSGRLEQLVYLGLPDLALREMILRLRLKDTAVSESEIANLAAETDGYSGADLTFAVQQAKSAAAFAGLDQVDVAGVKSVFDETPPSVTDMRIYRNLEKKLARKRPNGGMKKDVPDKQPVGTVMLDTTMCED